MAALAAFYSDDAGLDLGAWSRDMAGTISKGLNRRVVLADDPANHSFRNISDAQHSLQSQSSSPSVPTNNGADMTTEYSRIFNGISQRHRDAVPSRRDAKELIRQAFTSTLPQGRYPAKEIASEIGAAQSTVEGWRKPDGVMSADFLVLLQCRYPQFDAELRRLFRLQADTHPDAPRLMAQLVSLLTRGTP